MSGTLNRQRFVDAALLVIAEVGVERLSMRRGANQLGVSAMAMYKHFANKDELVAAAFEEFIARAEVLPDDGLPWDDWLSASARGMYRALCSEMSWVPLLGSTAPWRQRIGCDGALCREVGTGGFERRRCGASVYGNDSACGWRCLYACLVTFRSSARR